MTVGHLLDKTREAYIVQFRKSISGVIHFISDPKREDVATIFEVDFGSAPVEAFEELLDAFQASGAKKIEIF